MFKRLVTENIWSITVPVSVLCLVAAFLIGAGSGITVLLAWMAISLAYAGGAIIALLVFRRSSMSIQIRWYHLVLNLSWAVLVGTLMIMGKLAPLTRPMQADYYPGMRKADLVDNLGILLRDRWLKADRDMYGVDTSALLLELHDDAESVVWIVPTGRDSAIILLKRSDDMAWRYELTDIEDLDGEWLAPAPWDAPAGPAPADNTEWGPGEPIKRR